MSCRTHWAIRILVTMFYCALTTNAGVGVEGVIDVDRGTIVELHTVSVGIHMNAANLLLVFLFLRSNLSIRLGLYPLPRSPLKINNSLRAPTISIVSVRFTNLSHGVFEFCEIPQWKPSRSTIAPRLGTLSGAPGRGVKPHHLIIYLCFMFVNTSKH